jgi:hypothetical protein
VIFLYLCNLCNLWSKPSLFAFQLSNSGKLPPLSNPLLRFAPEGVLTPPCPNEKTNLIPDLQSSIHDLTAMADREGLPALRSGQAKMARDARLIRLVA